MTSSISATPQQSYKSSNELSDVKNTLLSDSRKPMSYARATSQMSHETSGSTNFHSQYDLHQRPTQVSSSPIRISKTLNSSNTGSTSNLSNAGCSNFNPSASLPTKSNSFYTINSKHHPIIQSNSNGHYIKNPNYDINRLQASNWNLKC